VRQVLSLQSSLSCHRWCGWQCNDDACARRSQVCRWGWGWGRCRLGQPGVQDLGLCEACVLPQPQGTRVHSGQGVCLPTTPLVYAHACTQSRLVLVVCIKCCQGVRPVLNATYSACNTYGMFDSQFDSLCDCCVTHTKFDHRVTIVKYSVQYLSATCHELCRHFLGIDLGLEVCYVMLHSSHISLSACTCVYRQMAVGDPLAAPPSPQLPQSGIPLMTVAMPLHEGCHSQEWVLHPQAAGLPLTLAEG